MLRAHVTTLRSPEIQGSGFRASWRPVSFEQLLLTEVPTSDTRFRVQV